MDTIGTERPGDRYRNHAQVWELLPWYLNGSLSAEESQRVSAHAAVCLTCRKELSLQSSLRDCVRSYELDELLVNASFARLSTRLQDQDGMPLPSQDVGNDPRRGLAGLAGALKNWWQQQFGSRGFAAAVAVLALVVMAPGLAALFVGNNTFRTLSSGLTDTVPAADLRLIFADGVTESERDAILDAAGLSIVSGPDGRGLYLVDAGNVSAGSLAATLEQLRANDDILFAEPGAP